MCFICMIIKWYQVFFENFVNQKIGVCDESPPKMRTVAETLLGEIESNAVCHWLGTNLESSLVYIYQSVTRAS